MAIEIKPVVLGLPEDAEGALVFMDGALIAVASRLSAQHENFAGSWNVEVVFGLGSNIPDKRFPDVQSVCQYFEKQVA